MEMTLEKEFILHSNFHKTMKIFVKMINYYIDCNDCDMSFNQWCEIVDQQLTQVISEGRLDEVYNKIIQ